MRILIHGIRFTRGRFSLALRDVFSKVLPAIVLLLSCSLLHAQSDQTGPLGGTIRGIVKSGNMPLPGATVTVVNASTGQKIGISSNVDGTFEVPHLVDGQYTVSAQMPAFAPLTRTVQVGAENPNAQVTFELTLLSRARQTQERPNGSTNGRGFQSLSLTQTGDIEEQPANGISQVAPAGLPVPGIAPDSATESVTFSGAASNPVMEMNTDDLRQRFAEQRQQGSFGAGGGGGTSGQGGFGGRGGFGGTGAMFGGRGGFNANRLRGSVSYTIGDSALNAAPYSLTGQPSTKPDYLQQRFSVALGGPLNIPGIYKGGDKTFFFLNYNGSRSSNPYDAFSTVPTLDERRGDFSNALVQSGGTTSPVAIFDPATGLQFQNNTILPGQISSIAQGLLEYIPPPNLPGQAQNFHFATSVNNNSDDLNIRLNRSLGGTASAGRRQGPRNSFNIGFHYHASDANLTNPFPGIGGTTNVHSYDFPIGFTRTFGKFTNIARADFNRSTTRTQNLFAYKQDITGDLDINGVSQNPFDWGLPNISLTNFGSLSDTNPLLLRNQTLTFSDYLIWTHKKHTFRWGADFRRIQLNTATDSNARGSFIFTGLNTSEMVNGHAVSGTGFDFADFLLGLPQQTSIQYGTNSYYFRGNSWDLFTQDEWRIRGNLTLNLGLRYEYVSPMTEKYNHIVNLDVAPGFTAVAAVLPGQAGLYTGLFPTTLVNPDRNNFAPRVGIAWKLGRKIVVRAGYGINYNTGAYQSIAQKLAFQPPFSTTATNVQSAETVLTLQNGFPSASPGSVTKNYGVDRNYHLGYVQIWNLDIQQEITPSVVLNLDYTGTKGTHLDILEAPNRTATGVLIHGVQPFNWETSAGDSVAHAGSLRVRKRLQKGFSIGGTYTFSKSIDNASSIGGGGTVVAQNAFDLAAERGLSSFDQRHKFTADYLWELPFGHNKHWLGGKGSIRDVLGDWQWSGSWTIASGLPFTPRVLGNISDVSRGTNGTLRPDATGLPVSVPQPSTSEWFNTAAFIVPPAGQFGDASRNSIIGPGTLLFNMVMAKTFTIKDNRVLEFRISASNLFNHPQYSAIDTTVNSPTFGRVTAVGSMRTVQLIARFRF